MKLPLGLVLAVSRVQLSVYRAVWPDAVYPAYPGTVPGAKYRSIKRPKVYEALRRKGKSKTVAAKISNAMASRRSRKKK